mgnify:CR=1 FL=1
MEISNNPESMTEKEKEDMTKLFESFKALVKSYEPYNNIEPVLKNIASTLSECFYQEYFIMSAILEAFIKKMRFHSKNLMKPLSMMFPKNSSGRYP